jgi:hypothetical protein
MNSKGNYKAAWVMCFLLILPAFAMAQSKAVENWTTKDLKVAISNAKTAQDHLRIAQYYTLQAGRHEAEAKDHLEVGSTYHEHAPKRAAQAEAYCRALANEYAGMAKGERELAKIHEDMSKATSQ